MERTSESSGKDIFFAALQMSRLPMCLTDPNQPDLPLVFVNEAFQRLTGYDEAELLGRNCRFMQGEATDPAMVRQLREAIAAHRDVTVELVNYRRDGTLFWNALYISPVFDPPGQLRYFFASQLDVTRRKQAEAALLQAQRMEAVGSMASGVAHEFNGLLTVVIGSAQQAMARAVDERQRRQLDRIEAAARSAGRLTQQMLSFARRQFHSPKLADLNRLVEAMGSGLAKLSGGSVHLTLDLMPSPLPVSLDAGQLELALDNLVRNAVDAMPAGGRLTVRTALPDGDAAGQGIALTVTDTGVGMTPEVAHRAVEPFFTTRPSGKGRGLGLSMVAGFAEQSGGRLDIESAPGQGTRITLRLPRAL